MKRLIINPEYGMAGDMLSAALISAGIPEKQLVAVMKSAADQLGFSDISIVNEKRGSTGGIYLNISLDDHLPGIEVPRAFQLLKNTCRKHKIKGEYEKFAHQALKILGEAEHKVHEKESIGPHHHSHTPHLHEAQDIIIDLAGAAFGLQELGIDLSSTLCLSPVRVGGGKITFSHGTLDVPAPATAQIIRDFSIPVKAGPVEKELLTPTGAAILAALNPEYIIREAYNDKSPSAIIAGGTGFGSFRLDPEKAGPNALYIFITDTE